jgi:mono/diheme cytochrome c family protein
MRYFLLIFVLTVVGVAVIAGKRGHHFRKPPFYIFPDMDRQPKLRPQEPNKFFANGISSQFPVAGTIARGERYEEVPANTGKMPGTTNFVETIPIQVTAELMNRGRERFNVYCSPCHGAGGDGKGVTTKLGMAVIADLHDTKTRRVPQQSDGEIFNTISNGKNLMQGYASQIPTDDRWAIVGYVRALQRSRLATLEDVPADQRAEIGRAMTAAAAPPAGTNAPAGKPAAPGQAPQPAPGAQPKSK